MLQRLEAALAALWVICVELFRDTRGFGSVPTPFVSAFQGVPVNTIRYQTSQQGIPVQLVYGTTRVTPNLLEFFDYVAPPGGKGGKGGGGKSSGGKKSGNYSVFVAFGVCQGPLSAPFTGNGGNNAAWANGGETVFSKTGLNGYDGTDGQAVDPVFSVKDPNTPVLNYSGLVYNTGDPLQLGQSPALPTYSVEISGFSYGTAGPLMPSSANPGLVIVDMLSNARYGAGFPSSALDTSGTIADFENYCQAYCLGIAVAMDRQRPASDWVKSWLELLTAAAVWSGSILKIIPYATVGGSQNGGTWNPSRLSPIYSLDDDDLLPWEGNSRDNSDAEPGSGPSDPVQVKVADPRTLPNWVSFEYWDNGNAYNTNLVVAYDQSLLDLYGPRPETSKEAHCFVYAVAAQNAANVYLARKFQVRRTFKFKLPWNYCLLEPMDVVALADSYAGLPAGTAISITSVEEDDNGELTFEAEELPNVPAGLPPLYPTQTPTNQPSSIFADPGNANAPIIYEPPSALAAGANILAIGSSSSNDDWGGAQVWTSLDGTTFTYAGTITPGLQQGVLSASLAAYGGANPDTTDTLSVDLTESGGVLSSTTATQAAAGVTLCYCDGELLTFETATLTATSKYNLSTLYRGFYGTTAGSHASGANFALIGLTDNPGVLEIEYPANLVGQTIYVKLLSFNRAGSELQDLSSVSDYAYTLTGAGVANWVQTNLDNGLNEDWGTVGATVIGSLDLGAVNTGSTDHIDLGIV